MKTADRPPSPLERRFILDVDAHPFDQLTQGHSPTTMGVCISQGWVQVRKTGGHSVTPAGTLAVAQ